MKIRIFGMVALAALTACAEVTRWTEWQDVPDETLVGTVLDIGDNKKLDLPPFSVTNGWIPVSIGGGKATWQPNPGGGGGGSLGKVTQLQDENGNWHNVSSSWNSVTLKYDLIIDPNVAPHEEMTVQQEAYRAVMAESDLDDRLTAETAARMVADLELDEKISAISSLGRFISTWNCATGKPGTEPLGPSIVYQSGDYYIVGAVSTGKNYIPHGLIYYKDSTSTVEATDVVSVNDVYRFTEDGTWLHIAMSGISVTWENIAGEPTNSVRLVNTINSLSRIVTTNTVTKEYVEGLGIDAGIPKPLPSVPTGNVLVKGAHSNETEWVKLESCDTNKVNDLIATYDTTNITVRMNALSNHVNDTFLPLDGSKSMISNLTMGAEASIVLGGWGNSLLYMNDDKESGLGHFGFGSVEFFCIEDGTNWIVSPLDVDGTRVVTVGSLKDGFPIVTNSYTKSEVDESVRVSAEASTNYTDLAVARDAVKYTVQTNSDARKAQARTNINAIALPDVIDRPSGEMYNIWEPATSMYDLEEDIEWKFKVFTGEGPSTHGKNIYVYAKPALVGVYFDYALINTDEMEPDDTFHSYDIPSPYAGDTYPHTIRLKWFRNETDYHDVLTIEGVRNKGGPYKQIVIHLDEFLESERYVGYKTKTIREVVIDVMVDVEARIRADLTHGKTASVTSSTDTVSLGTPTQVKVAVDSYGDLGLSPLFTTTNTTLKSTIKLTTSSKVDKPSETVPAGYVATKGANSNEVVWAMVPATNIVGFLGYIRDMSNNAYRVIAEPNPEGSIVAAIEQTPTPMPIITIDEEYARATNAEARLYVSVTNTAWCATNYTDAAALAATNYTDVVATNVATCATNYTDTSFAFSTNYTHTAFTNAAGCATNYTDSATNALRTASDAKYLTISSDRNVLITNGMALVYQDGASFYSVYSGNSDGLTFRRSGAGVSRLVPDNSNIVTSNLLVYAVDTATNAVYVLSTNYTDNATNELLATVTPRINERALTNDFIVATNALTTAIGDEEDARAAADTALWTGIGEVDAARVAGDTNVAHCATNYTDSVKTDLDADIAAEATARADADALLIPLAQKAAASGVATLDANVKVPYAQIPNDAKNMQVYEALESFPPVIEGITNRLYVAKDTGNMYRFDPVLGYIKLSGGGGGEGVTNDYSVLINKPQIGGVTLVGNKTLSMLNIQPKLPAYQEGKYLHVTNGVLEWAAVSGGGGGGVDTNTVQAIIQRNIDTNHVASAASVTTVSNLVVTSYQTNLTFTAADNGKFLGVTNNALAWVTGGGGGGGGIDPSVTNSFRTKMDLAVYGVNKFDTMPLQVEFGDPNIFGKVEEETPGSGMWLWNFYKQDGTYIAHSISSPSREEVEEWWNDVFVTTINEYTHTLGLATDHTPVATANKLLTTLDKGVASGVATLDANKKLSVDNLPPNTINQTIKLNNVSSQGDITLFAPTVKGDYGQFLMMSYGDTPIWYSKDVTIDITTPYTLDEAFTKAGCEGYYKWERTLIGDTMSTDDWPEHNGYLTLINRNADWRHITFQGKESNRTWTNTKTNGVWTGWKELGSGGSGGPTDTLILNGDEDIITGPYVIPHGYGEEGQMLVSKGTNAPPEWSDQPMMVLNGTITNAIGPVVIPGGYGQKGQILVGNNNSSPTWLSSGTIGSILTSNGEGANPSWLSGDTAGKMLVSGGVSASPSWKGTETLTFTKSSYVSNGTITARRFGNVVTINFQNFYLNSSSAGIVLGSINTAFPSGQRANNICRTDGTCALVTVDNDGTVKGWNFGTGSSSAYYGSITYIVE